MVISRPVVSSTGFGVSSLERLSLVKEIGPPGRWVSWLLLMVTYGVLFIHFDCLRSCFSSSLHGSSGPWYSPHFLLYLL